MLTANEFLRDQAVSRAVDFASYNNGVVRRIMALLNRTDADLLAQISAALEQLPAESFTVERLDSLLYSAQSLNRDAYNEAGKELTKQLRELVEYEAGYQQQLFEHVLPVQVNVASVVVEQVYSAALSRPMQSRLLSEWASGIEASRMVRIRDALRLGYVEGQTISQMVARIRGTRARGYSDGLLEIDRRNCTAVVRTATAHVANFTRQRFYEGNDSLIKALTWCSTLDSRTSAVCRARDGVQYPTSSGPRPPAHWNCLPGDSQVLVRGKITRAYKRPYKGNLFVIKTASGREISCTPNHPILSEFGWVAAQSLNLGDNIVCDGVSDGVSANDSENDNVPSSIKDIAEAFFVSAGVLTIEVPISAPDFHGDGIGSQVAIVGTDSSLLVGYNPAIREHSSQIEFSHRHSLALPLLIGTRRQQFCFHRSHATSSGDVCGAGSCGAFLGCCSSHSGELLLAAISCADSGLFKERINGRDGDIEALGNASDSYPAIEHSNRVIHTESGDSGGISGVLGVAAASCDSVLFHDADNHVVGDAKPFGDSCHSFTSVMFGDNIGDRDINQAAVGGYSVSFHDVQNIRHRHFCLNGDDRRKHSSVVHGDDVGHDLISGELQLLYSSSDANASAFEDSFNGVVSCPEHPANLLCASTFGVQGDNRVRIKMLSPVPDRAEGIDSVVDDGDVDAKIASDILNGNSGPVFLDNIISINVREFSDHVYNLETDCGWFVADGIITHNCRSTMVPVLKSWRSMGIDMDELPESTRASVGEKFTGQVPETMTYQDWLRKQSAGYQDDILGVAKGKLFRDGGLPLDRFVDRAGKEYTLDQLRERDAATFKRAGL